MAVVGLIGAIVWGVLNFGVWSEVNDFARTDIPGEVAIDIDDTGTYTIYYERREWFASVPVNVDLDVTVTDPTGETVPVSARSGAENYRQFRRVGQSHASFDATTTGPHTVTVEGVAPHDDSTIAVGESVTGMLFRDLLGPILLLVASFVIAGIIVLSARTKAS